MKLPARWKELSPLFDELVELDAAVQAARLAALRARDAGLADELAAMLEAAARARRREFLERPPRLHDDPAAAMAGRRIGAYVVEAELGRGGSGSVWKARRADGRFDGFVAIKLLHLSLAGRAGVARFHREGAILSRLTHPDIARLLDAGLTAEGQPYLVLEHVDGKPIDRYCDDERLGIDARMKLLVDVMCCVGHAHAQLVVHRDLKPSNILVTADGRVKLLDFGIAKLLQDDQDATALTADGQHLLTPRYAAPEQLEGGPVTTATDIYSLGVLMYRLLVGRYATAADGASASEVIAGTLTAEPARLEKALDRPPGGDESGPQEIAARRGTSPKALQRRLRGDLDAIAARALRKAPGERYESVFAFAADLRRNLDGLPVSARPGTTRYRLGKLVRRHRGATFASALLVLSIAAGLGGTITQAHQARRERDLALHQLKNAESTREFVQFLLSEGSDGQAIAPGLLEHGEQLVDREFAKDAEERTRLLLLLGRLYGEANLQTRALALMLRAQEGARGVEDPDLGLQVQCQLAWQYADGGEVDRALPLLDAAIASSRASTAPNNTTLSGCLYNRSEARNRRGDFPAALADVREALAVLGDPRPDQRAEAINMRARMASIQSRLGDAAAAARELGLAIADLDAVGRGQTQSARTLNNNLGALLNLAGRPADAARALTKAMEISRKVGHPDAITEGNFARVLIELGHPREAMAMTQEALDSLAQMSDTTVGPTVAEFGAPAWCAVGDLVHCRRLLEQARDGFAASSLQDKASIPTLRVRMAQLLEQEGDLRGARDEMRRGAAELEAIHNRGTAKALALLARLDLAAGDRQQALAHARQATTVAQAGKGGFEHTAWLGSALLSQGLVLRALGDEPAARKSLAAALEELHDASGDDAPETIAARAAMAQKT